MSQSGYTPIQLYRTTTAAAAPTAGNLAAGELAINLTDEKLFFKNAAGTVKTLASSGASTVGGSNTQVQFNSSGVLGGSANFVFDGTNVGIGTSSPQAKLHLLDTSAVYLQFTDSADGASRVGQNGTAMTFGVDGANGTTERMRIAASGRVGIGTTDPQLQLVVSNGGAGGLELDPSGTMQSYNRSTSAYQSVTLDGSINIFRISGTERMRIDASGQVGIGTTAPPQLLAVGNTTDQFGAGVSGAVTTAYFGSPSSGSGGIKRIAYDRSTGSMNFIGGTVASASTQMALTVDGFLEAVYSDDVVALGNSGTATNIDLRQGNVFTATLTGNCTFTLTNPNANTNRGSSFTLILTNDGTAGRTVAWAGGTFRFPGGAASLSRTTTANAVDIWVFFTPNNGTTWYGNISMKNMIA